MLDIRYIREHAKEVQTKSEQKGYSVDVSSLLKLDDERRVVSQELEEQQRVKKEHARELGKEGGKPSDDALAKGRDVKVKIAALEEKLKTIDEQFLPALKKIPNMPLDFVPVGASEDENVIAKTVGEPTKFDFAPKNHWQIGEARGMIDKERAAKIAGSRFAYVKGNLVRLQIALVHWAIDVLTDAPTLQRIIDENKLKVSAKPFVPVLPPAVIRTEAYEATGRLNAEEQTYKLADDDLWLNASAEHSMAPMYMNEILPEAELPIRYVAYATSFRREAGTYGKDMEGIFRLHQFDKLEMEAFTTPETGLDEHKLQVAIQEYLMQQLGLPYEFVQKCTADIGKPNAAGVDLNAWFPGQGRYRETHTADYMTDFQSRDLKIRVRRQDGRTDLVHTADATAFAMSRILKALMENNQTAEGRIRVPEVLRP
ncbi:MAG TPA: serine--tRNA ligase, partial [Candidatus Saccharimonadales bacterium]|nr:serine--tRNA ligase [Candidatus Saccharimonadales bacterium]